MKIDAVVSRSAVRLGSIDFWSGLPVTTRKSGAVAAGNRSMCGFGVTGRSLCTRNVRSAARFIGKAGHAVGEATQRQ